MGSGKSFHTAGNGPCEAGAASGSNPAAPARCFQGAASSSQRPGMLDGVVAKPGTWAQRVWMPRFSCVVSTTKRFWSATWTVRVARAVRPRVCVCVCVCVCARARVCVCRTLCCFAQCSCDLPFTRNHPQTITTWKPKVVKPRSGRGTNASHCSPRKQPPQPALTPVTTRRCDRLSISRQLHTLCQQCDHPRHSSAVMTAALLSGASPSPSCRSVLPPQNRGKRRRKRRRRPS